jgi:hypothetical protein
MDCIGLCIGGGTDDYINAAGPASGEIRPIKPFFLRFYQEAYDRKKRHDASIPVVVPVIIPIVMVPMMVPAPLVQAVFVRMSIIAVSVITIVVISVFLVSGVNVNAEPIVCLGFGRCQSNQPERRQP